MNIRQRVVVRKVGKSVATYSIHILLCSLLNVRIKRHCKEEGKHGRYDLKASMTSRCALTMTDPYLQCLTPLQKPVRQTCMS